MAACNDDFTLIDHEESQFSSHHITSVPPPSKPATESDSESDPNRTPSITNGKRASYKKLKAGSGSEFDYRIDYRKDREEWCDNAIACLLDAYVDKFTQLNRGNLRGRDWEEVADIVNEKQKSGKTVEQCKNKIDNLKKRYKVEVQRISGGGLATSHWHWFKKMECIVGNSMCIVSKSVVEEEKNGSSGGSPVSPYVSRQSKRYVPSSSALNISKPKSLTTPKWRRVVFKISGAALVGNGQSIDPKVAMQIANEVSTACRLGVEVAIVVGGRNFFCGDSWVSATGLDRPTAYQIG